MGTGHITSDITPVYDIDAITTADFKYGNGLSLSPAGSDGIQWMGISYANENQLLIEKERAFFLTMPKTEAGLSPRFLLVNDEHFDEDSLVPGWDTAYPELEVVRLPADPLNGSYTINFPHNIEMFQAESGVRIEDADWDLYRVIIASLGISNTEDNGATQDELSTNVYMFDLYAPTGSNSQASHAKFFCGFRLSSQTESHFDFLLPVATDDSVEPFQWVGAYTSNPSGSLFWLDLWELNQADPIQRRCKMIGSQSHDSSADEESKARPIWASELDPTQLYSTEVLDVQVGYTASTLEPAM